MSTRAEPIEGARAVLRDLPLLALMPPDARRLVEDSFVPVRFPFGAVIVREGDDADAFYVLVAGTARVVKASERGEEVPLNVLRPGEGFGERALLAESKRTATVRASSEVQALRLDRSIFQALAAGNPEIRSHLDLLVRRHHLRDFLRLHTAFGRLPPDTLAAILAELHELRVDAGGVVVRQGDPPGAMYLVQDGRLRAYRDEDGRSEDVAYLRTGDAFGEIALFTGEPRRATVEAVSACTLLELSADTFHRLIDDHPRFRDHIAERISQYDYRRLARVPLDFAQELLPADVEAQEKVGLDQVDEIRDAGSADEEEAGEWEAGLFARPEHRLRRFPHIWQIDEQDCGAACVAMVCRHFGADVTLARIRHAVHTGVDGTSLLGIARGAEEVGLASRTVKASKSRLDELPLPAIVHWEGNHWVVLYDTDAEHVRVADPARGLRRLPRAQFESDWTGYAALLAPTPALSGQAARRSPLAWVAELMRPYRGGLQRALGLALVAAALQMAIPVLAQVVVDHVIERSDSGPLALLVPAMAAALVVAFAAVVAARRILSRATVRIDGSVLDALTGRLLALPMSWFITRRSGDVERRLAGVREVRALVLSDGVQGITAALQLVIAVGVMVVYSWRLALVYLAAVPVYAALMRYGSRRLRPMVDSIEESLGRYHARQVEVVRGIETIKATSAEDAIRDRMSAQFREVSHRLARASMTTMVYEGAIQTVTFVSLALFLWIGALEALHGRLTVGELVAFNALVLLGNAAVATLMLLWDRLQQASVLLDRLSDVLEQEPEQVAGDGAPVPTLEGRLTLEGLCFHYGGPAAVLVLDGITLDVPAGTTVGIVGRSGSGKTTLAKCIAALLDPTAGAIRYDGIDGRTLDRRQLRRHIGFVLQDSHLFDDTIARNIAVGEEHPDVEAVMRAARVAGAHEFIQRLPLGYDTRVGDSGLLLSGGQRQRIAIARAVYHRPPVVILDEATASLDAESERTVKENLDRLLETRTAFVVTPRPSAVRDADVIVVLEKGRIVEQGTHEELMARQGLYYYLSSQQLER